ncbi:MAG: hypothetical protein E4H16_00260 [Candidatus Atribacteria bacterium]|nr:MAG: hypothetical protein E4H16_00260 [Candidatus Atribacteria bacterium]
MLTEKQLISKIQELRQIKPSQNWVSFTKSQILGEDEKKSFASFGNYNFGGFRLKFAMASIMTLALMLGGFGILERSLPGDVLYSVRSAFHKAQTVLIPEQEKPSYQLKLANDRLDDLAKAPAKNLAPTIIEFQANISEAAKELTKMDATTSNPVMIRKIVDANKKINENKLKVESLGVVIGGEKESAEWNTALGKVVGDLIKDLESKTLSDGKQEVLAEMKKLFEEGKYSESLEFYLTNQ